MRPRRAMPATIGVNQSSSACQISSLANEYRFSARRPAPYRARRPLPFSHNRKSCWRNCEHRSRSNVAEEKGPVDAAIIAVPFGTIQLRWTASFSFAAVAQNSSPSETRPSPRRRDGATV